MLTSAKGRTTGGKAEGDQRASHKNALSEPHSPPYPQNSLCFFPITTHIWRMKKTWILSESNCYIKNEIVEKCWMSQK